MDVIAALIDFVGDIFNLIAALIALILALMAWLERKRRAAQAVARTAAPSASTLEGVTT